MVICSGISERENDFVLRADCTVQDIFNHFYPDYEKSHSLSAMQRKAAYHIMNCKTGSFGVNVSVCEDCGCISVHYYSCRDRCCPMCQEFPKEKPVDARREDVLDAPYFHVVFTVPEELNLVIYSNQKLIYTALYHAKDNGEDLFLLIKAISRLFRGKYTHRIAISNYRVKSMTNHSVTFAAKDYRQRGEWKNVTISGEEFIRRFLMHAPPKRFARIRHYGLLSSRNKNKKITMC